MRTAGRGRLRWLLASCAVAGCAQVLGLPEEDELKSAARAFCKCDDLTEAWPGEACESHVEGRLVSADSETRRAWLDLFEKEGCEQCDNEAGRARCAGSAPLCVNTLGACGSTNVCCLADGDRVYCGAQGICVEDAAGCLEPDAPCEPGATACCGEVGQLAGCVPGENGSVCVESCNPTDDGNCKGCCLRAIPEIDDVPQTAASLCASKNTDCSDFCNLDGDGTCKQGRACMPFPVYFGTGQEGWIDWCYRSCDVAAGEVLGSACTSTILDAPDVPGCCARVSTNGQSPAPIACAVTGHDCADFCDPEAPVQTCNCIPEEVALTDGKVVVYVCAP
ncbi:MAG: hypothetical protein JNL21_02805 [Myxococcales bacterium]|nr:hypothetical protein [Myxococcales bacterium]